MAAVSRLKRIALAFVILAVAGGSMLGAAWVRPAFAAPAATQSIIVNRVVFEGNSKMRSEQLLPVVDLKPGTTYSASTLAADVQRLREAYARSGRSAVTISSRTVELPNDRVDIVYTVAEGGKIGVSEIRFTGNTTFGDWRLKRQVSTIESGWLSFIRTSDTYDPERINGDQDRLRQFYINRGFPDMRVVSTNAELNSDQSGYIITFNIEEGQRYSFGPSTVQSSVSGIEGDSLAHDIYTSPGSTYDSADIDKTVQAMTLDLSRRGSSFAQVRPRGDRNPDGSISITYVVEEGARVYIERINITGNTRTRDYVIRREFDVGEGDPYNKAFIDEAARRLRNLGYFESVVVTTEPGTAPDRVVVDVAVVDQATGQFSVGGGYSTADGFIGEVSLSEKNFLGRGQYAKIAVQYGQRTEGAQFSFTEPYFLGQRIAAGFDVFSKVTDSSSFSYYRDRETGGTLRATLPVTDDFSVGVHYTGYQQSISIPDDDYKDCTNLNPITPANCLDNGEASLAVKDIVGSRFVSMIGYTLTYDTLDDRRVPSSGFFATAKQDFAGVGGDAHFVRTTGDLHYYYPVSDDLTLMLRAQGGHIAEIGGGDLAIVDQFNLGPDLVRGFAPGGIGPRDLNGGGRANPLGGTIYYGGTAELQFPILGLPRELNFRGALFADVGTLYDYQGRKNFATGSIDLSDQDKLRSSVGASLLWASPVGPLRFDYAYVLSKDDHDRTQAFRFSGGTSF